MADRSKRVVVIVLSFALLALGVAAVVFAFHLSSARPTV